MSSDGHRSIGKTFTSRLLWPVKAAIRPDPDQIPGRIEHSVRILPDYGERSAVTIPA